MVYPIEAEIIKTIRNAKGITQVDLANLLSYDPRKIMAIEAGKEDYTPEDIHKVKEYLGIQGMPLTYKERVIFIKKLFRFRDIIPDDRFDEIKALYEELLPVLNFECFDPELALYFRLFEVIMLVRQGEVSKAKEEMSFFTPDKVEEMNPRHLYHYYCNQARFLHIDHELKKALKLYKKALKLTKNHEGFSRAEIDKVNANVAVCLSSLCYPNSALMFLSRVNYEDENSHYSLNADSLIAVNYARIGEYEEAQELIDETLIRAKSAGNKLYTSLSLYYFGIIYIFSKTWDKGIERFDEALGLFEKDSFYYMWSIYYKIRCLIEKRDFNAADKILKETEALFSTSDYLQIHFNFLYHFRIISKSITNLKTESAEYIENIAIPYFLKIQSKYEAIRACELLIEHYRRTQRETKALKITELLLEIHKSLNVSDDGYIEEEWI